MESDSGTEFDHYLAEKLGMTVGELQRRMSAEEWMRWSVYYGRKAQRIEMERLRGRRGGR